MGLFRTYGRLSIQIKGASTPVMQALRYQALWLKKEFFERVGEYFRQFSLISLVFPITRP